MIDQDEIRYIVWEPFHTTLNREFDAVESIETEQGGRWPTLIHGPPSYLIVPSVHRGIRTQHAQYCSSSLVIAY